MRSSVEKKMIRIIAGLLMVCMLFPMLPAAAVEETEAVCTCGTVEGVHGEECALYEAPAEGETTPETTEPETTEPEITEPETTEPETTEPEVTEPEVTEPETTEPEAAEPETTEPVLVVEDEHEAKKLNEGTPTMTVTFDGAAIPNDGIYKNWHYNDKKALKVALSGLTPNQTYTVTIQLDEIVYFEPIPTPPKDGTYNVTFQQNDLLPIAKADENGKAIDENGYLEDGSGTAVFTFTPAKESLSFGVDLKYDVALWNRKAGTSLRWDKTAGETLVKVTLNTGSEMLKTEKLDDATAAESHHANVNEYDGTNGIKPMLDGANDIRLEGYYTDQKVRMRIRGFSNNFYFGTMVLDVELPHCQIGDTVYYMEYESSESASDSNANYNIVVEKEAEGRLKVTIPYVYEPKNPNIIDLVLKFPEGLMEETTPGETYDFPYKITYHVNGDEYVPNWYGERTLTVRGGTGGYLEFFQPMPGAASTDTPEGVVDPLGGVGLVNTGNEDCNNVKLILEFDIENTNAIGVTSVNLMTDLETEMIKIQYQMVDEDGNLYPAGEELAEIEIKNDDYNTDRAGFGRYVTFHRGMLPDEYKTLYFKKIEYAVGKIESGVSLGAQSNPRSTHTPGSYWGRALKADTEKPLSQVTIASATWGDEGKAATVPANPYKIDTRINQPKDTKMQVYYSSTKFDPDEIYAGDIARLRVYGDVDYYVNKQPYAYLDGLRVGLLLPTGININKPSIKGKFGTVEIGEDKINLTHIKNVDEKNDFWILEFPDGYPIGGAQEDLTTLPNGKIFDISLEIQTPRNMSTTTVVLSDILYVAGKDFTTAYSAISKRDLYDVNQNGKKDDIVTGLSVINEGNLIIRGNNVSLNITDEIWVNGGVQENNDIAINSASDVVEYRMNIKNQNGGKAENFVSYFKIPQTLKNGNGDKIVMSGAGTVVNNPGSTELMWMYTTQTAADLDAVQALPASDWVNSVSNWASVTWAKLVTVDSTGIQNGSESNAEIPLVYSGNDYSYNAGATTTVKSEGTYDYVRGSFSLPSNVDTIERTLSVHYKESSAKGETTLTAAMDRNPTAPNVNTWQYNTGLTFHNPQEFRVENLTGYNVELVDMKYDPDMKALSGEESNKKYMIKAGLTNAGEAILEGAELGTLAKDVNASFVFDLYNGNILTDAATQRFVTFDLVSDYVTIPVKINIQQEATLAEAGAPAIVAGKRYAPITDSTATSVSVSKDSAFTAQFVVDNMNANYGARTLIFGNELSAGTTFVLIDYAELNAPRYARYVATGGETLISLNSFIMMGKKTTEYTSHVPDASEEAAFKEQLLFVVDFPGGNVSGNTVKLKIDRGKNDKDIETEALSVNVASQRGFSATISDNTTVGDKFTLEAKVTAAGAYDSRYNGRKMAFVVDGSNVPADGKLTVDGVEYYRNSDNRYIIPVGVAQTNGSYTKELVLEADSLKNGGSCTLIAELWVSATAAEEKPMMGERVASGLSITLTSAKGPSLKVNSMSQRVLDDEELKENVSLSYSTEDVPTGAAVTLEVQKAVGGMYLTEATYVEQVTGSTAADRGVYTVPDSDGNLTLRFSSRLEAGNYRILFKVTDSSGNVLLEVPYRFVVVD